MTLVSESSCRAVYEFLSKIPPFKRWHMPNSGSVRFLVVDMPDFYGMYEPLPTHTITISSAKVGHLGTLLRTMAHEMIHLKMYCAKRRGWDDHGKPFLRMAEKISVTLGFDPKEL